VQLDERLLRQVGGQIRVAGEAIQVPDQSGEVSVEQLHHAVLERRCLQGQDRELRIVREMEPTEE
jgi:hypothetical protein